MASNDSINDDEAFSFAMQWSTASVLPMVLKSALELDLLELIKKADPDASASELAAQLPTSNPDAASMLDRILWLLAAHSILICCPRTLPDGGVERRYSLAPISKFLTKNEDGVSVAPVCHMVQDKVFTDLWYHLKDAVLKGGIPFDRAHGSSIFDYLSTDPRASNVFNQNMSNISTIYMKKILEIYKGFEGIKTLVDVGGGTGATINMIISKYPSIKGINFDLPYVIREAPSYPGVEHVGGDMFVSVPKADAILLKWICHDWSDAHCEKLLKRCCEALPINGKVIISEQIITQGSTSGWSFPGPAIADMTMLGYNPGGKERTENEFRALAKKAGFKKFRKVCSVFGIWIMELYD